MPAEQLLALSRTHRRIEANDVNLSSSSFINVNLADAKFDDVNLCNTTINNANLSHLHITDANITGMTIEGVLVSDLQAAYRATRS